MFLNNVSNLVYVSDAYANLAPGDNFGTAEVSHNKMPSSFLLGDYGETRSRAELYARKRNGNKLPNGNNIKRCLNENSEIKRFFFHFYY